MKEKDKFILSLLPKLPKCKKEMSKEFKRGWDECLYDIVQMLEREME